MTGSSPSVASVMRADLREHLDRLRAAAAIVHSDLPGAVLAERLGAVARLASTASAAATRLAQVEEPAPAVVSVPAVETGMPPGDRVRVLRDVCRLTVDELADAAGVAAVSIRSFEKDGCNRVAWFVRRLAVAFAAIEPGVFEADALEAELVALVGDSMRPESPYTCSKVAKAEKRAVPGEIVRERRARRERLERLERLASGDGGIGS